MSEKSLPPRLELFSDAVFAIIITIMVLELHPPEGNQLTDLYPLVHSFISYALSFVIVIIYWNNHHHLLTKMTNPTGKIMWANNFLLFCLSLVPFSTAWMGRHAGDTIPTFLYGCILLVAAIAYTFLEYSIITVESKSPHLAKAIGSELKGKISLASYALAVIIAFFNPWISYCIFAGVALTWMLPDQRIEKSFEHKSS